MTTPNAQALLEKIKEEAKTNNKPDLRMVRTMKAGQWARQGDINVTYLKALPEDLKSTTERQLAPGNTKGSRHVVDGNPKLYVRTNPDPLQGPIIEAPERFTITHPEHANISLPSGCYEVTYQRDLMQEEIQRVAD